MRIEDLMIDDLVQKLEDSRTVVVDRNFFTDECEAETCAPIELNAEWLDRLGFEKVKSPGYCDVYARGHLQVWKEKYGDNFHVAATHKCIALQYVHELQHVMKLWTA